MRFMLPLAACLLLVLAASDSPAAGVILLRESFNKSSERFYDQLKFGLIAAGMPVEEVEAARLAQRLSAESDRGVVLVLPNSRYFPAEAKNPMQDFLKRDVYKRQTRSRSRLHRHHRCRQIGNMRRPRSTRAI